MSERKDTTLVAVPYYGTLSLPRLGLSRLFFVATVDTATATIRGIEIQVWDPKKEPNLSVWMRIQGFSGVICSDSGSHYRAALKAKNIWLVGGEEGEAVEVVERWLAGALDEPEEANTWLGRQLDSWCGPRPARPVLAV